MPRMGSREGYDAYDDECDTYDNYVEVALSLIHI